jgi:monofunctional biosynthetic peptidoglycan transglycosylase
MTSTEMPLPIEQEEAPPEEPRRKRGLLRRLFRLIVYLILASIALVVFYRFVPPPITFTQAGDLIEGRGLARNWVPLSRIDPSMARAAIAAEDGRFCEHNGFDFRAIEQAALRNAQGRRLRGGSTISQQTAKNVFLWQGQGYGRYLRKAPEIWFTVLIELIWGKRRIMEVYLNEIETGIGTYGVDAAAQRYYHHGAGQLTPREAAQIAAVLPLPKKRPAISPTGYVARYGRRIATRISVVRRDGLDRCLR